ncbi:MAG TPA: ABC transporter ATP-binding protein [Devosia sp.]|nr:ABC transporter ATP-binding protein [Devosia sp.]
MALVEVNGLTVSFGDARVLDGISFTIARGERFGIIGESGSGKTMTSLAVTGLLPDRAKVTGGVNFDGPPLPADEVLLARLRGKRIGLVFQEPMSALDPLMMAGAQIAEALALNGRTEDVGKTVDSLLVEVGLEPLHARRFPHELSGGQRQRVMIAIALAPEPDLLIADEPTSALDLITQRKILDLIDRLCRDRGMALMFISHDLKAVAALCTRVMVLHRGRMVETAEKVALFGNPRHDYTKQLIAAGRHRAKTLMRSPIGDPLLEVSGLTRRFRQPDISIFEPRPPLVAVNDVSFSLRSGESLALVGPSGSGKSTLARIIAGLDRASGGHMVFDRATYHGRDLPRTYRRDISLVFQDPFGSFNPRLTMRASVAEPLRLEPQRLPEEVRDRIVEIVTAVGLTPDMLERFPHEFSGGQRQRFAIARALITKPRLVILDEPVSALDVSVRGEVLVMLNRLRADFGLTFLIISHDLEMVRVVADRVMVMNKGRIIETGTPAQLLDMPKEDLTKELVAARLPEVGIVPVI